MDFDVLVLGTGLLESILSSSLSKQGLKVGHLDNKPFYGRSYSLFDQSKAAEATAATDALNAVEFGTIPKRCSLETSPKLVYANGSLTDLLIESKVGSYLEFKACDAIYVLVNSIWMTLPESKEDVFTNDALSLVEKRKLMKFISATKDMPKSNDFATFSQYLNSFDLGEDLIEMILYGILLLPGSKQQVYGII